MTICGSQNCACALTSSTLTVSGNGTPGSPWVVEQAEFTDITQLQVDVDNLEAAVANLPSTYLALTGGTLVGTLAVNVSGAALSLFRTGDTPFLQMMRQDGSRIGYLQGNDSSGMMVLQGDSGVGVRIATNGTYRGQVETSGNLLWTKTASGIANTGVEIGFGGSVVTTRADAGGQNVQTNKTGAGDANGEVHLSVRASGTQIGSITRATVSTTAFNTSSDEEQKENFRQVPDDLALYWLEIAEPWMFNFKAEPGNETVGFVAQRLAAAWPESIDYGIVTPGFGDINARTWDADGNETTPDDVWRGWSVDYSKFTSFQQAALRAVRNIQKTQADEIVDLREQILELSEQVRELRNA